jgi:plastocyanin
MKRFLLLVSVPVAIMVVATACASGPSPEVAARGLQPPVTTTTVPLAEGIVLIKIFNAAFQPAVLELDPNTFPVVRWENTDDVEYTIFARGDEFESPVITPGATWDFDFSTLEPGVYRYFIIRGAQTIPGLIDTRPAQ